LSVGKKAVKCK
jgi:hypothetical protein